MGKIVAVFIVVLFVATAYGYAGEFVPKTFYTIDRFGRESPKIPLRSKRDLRPLLRARRAGAYATSGSFAGSGNPEDFIPNFYPDDIMNHIQSLIKNIQAQQSTGNGGGTYGSSGPQLFSRFGEAEGSGVHVSGQAAGPNGAFSSSSSSIDDRGKIKYSVQSGKY